MPQPSDTAESGRGGAGANPSNQVPGNPHSGRQKQHYDARRDDDIYGHELMSAQELMHYRQQLDQQTTAESRARYARKHEERMRKRAMEQSKDLVPPGQGPIYGGKLMSVEERNEYRETLRNMKSEAEREQFEASHREEIQKRARALQIDIEEAE